MSWVAAAVGGAALVGGIVSSNAQASAAQDAANATNAASQSQLQQQQAQWDKIQALLAPYNTTGTNALNAQGNLLGLNGNDAQQSAIDAIKNGSQYQTLLQQGNNNILQNASATGGLRGGNTQSALEQFAPTLLNSLITNQVGNLNTLTQTGLGAATGTGSLGSANSAATNSILGQIGQANAGAALAQGKATANTVNAVTGALGSYLGAGGSF